MSDPSSKDQHESAATAAQTSTDDAGPRMVECVKFGKRMEGLPKPPLKGELGQKVFEQVSKEGWRMWLEHSKMLINEFHLDLMSEHGQKVWMTECERFFWGEGSELPPDYLPQRTK